MTQEKLHRIFTNPPTFETERLFLRKIQPEDFENMYEYSCLDEVTQYLLWDPHPDALYTKKYIAYLQERYAVGDFYDFAVVCKKDQKMIGTVGFTSFDLPNRSAEIGYVISPRYQGKGYASEAVKRIVRFGFEVCMLARISAVCMKDNAASLRVMQKNGFQREGLLRNAVYAKGRMQDVYLSAITDEDYFNITCI